jgi:hypothetical protein
MFLKINSQTTIYECSVYNDTSNMITNINISGVVDFSDILSAVSGKILTVDIYSDEECAKLVNSYKDNKIVSFNTSYENGTALIVIKPTDLQKEISELKDAVNSIESQINPEPIDPSTLSLEDAKLYQLDVVNTECTNAIYAGIDVDTSKGTEHFSLTDKDQINITALYTKCLSGTPSVPYHADDTICREFSAEEMIALGEATLKYVIYCTTMCNHIRAWIQRCETVDEVITIHFNSELPDDLQESFNSVISIGEVEVTEE